VQPVWRKVYGYRFVRAAFLQTYAGRFRLHRALTKQHGGVVINIGTPLVNHGLGGVPITAQMVSKGIIHPLTIQLAA